MNASLAKVEFLAKHWSTDRVIRAEKERYEAKQEARAVRLVGALARDAKDRAEVYLTTALNSLVAVE